MLRIFTQTVKIRYLLCLCILKFHLWDRMLCYLTQKLPSLFNYYYNKNITEHQLLAN